MGIGLYVLGVLIGIFLLFIIQLVIRGRGFSGIINIMIGMLTVGVVISVGFSVIGSINKALSETETLSNVTSLLFTDNSILFETKEVQTVNDNYNQLSSTECYDDYIGKGYENKSAKQLCELQRSNNLNYNQPTIKKAQTSSSSKLVLNLSWIIIILIVAAIPIIIMPFIRR